MRRKFKTIYTPKKNSVAERKSKAIMSMARSMLKGRNLSNEYWEELVACDVYVINRSPTKCVINRVLEKSW